MNSIIRLVVLVAGLVLLLNIAPSWGQDPVCVAPGCNPTVSDANYNTAGGAGALGVVDDVGSGGFSNTAFGNAALPKNTTGFLNTASGDSALNSNTTGAENIATGAGALFLNTTGVSNAATGVSALYFNTTGVGNVATGNYALWRTTGNNNTAIGFNALQQSTGTKNIGVGYRAGLALTTGNNNIYVGNQGVSSSESQTMRLGSTQTRTFVAGIGATPIVANAATVEIDTATGQLGVGGGSSARYKQDITPMGSQSTGLLQLRPVTFAYKEDVRHVKHYGLVAEEVATVYPELVTHTATGDAMTVRYQELIPMLLNELQRQREDLKRQQQELTELRALVAEQLAGQRTITAGPLLTQSETDEAVR